VHVLKRVQTNRLPAVEPCPVAFEGHIDDARFFLGTKTGLLYFDGRTLWRLLEGRVYGITCYKERWYATWNYPIALGSKRLSTAGAIVSFRFENEQIEDLRVDVAPLDQELHQIDAWERHIYVTDTAKNRVLAYSKSRNRLEYARAYHPNGILRNGKTSSNYAHINSVFRHEDHVYLMYHNQTEKTSRNSEIAVLQLDWQVKRVVETEGNSAHNVYSDGNEVVFCDSLNGRLIQEGRVLIDVGTYLRGLAVSDTFWLVGGSEHAKREERGFTDGVVYQYDPSSDEIIATLAIPDCGSLYEIRLITPEDLAMSS